MRNVPLLLLGFLGGVVVGYVLKPDPDVRVARGQPTAVAPEPERPSRAPPVPRGPAPMPPAPVVQPSGELPADSDAEEGTGWVEVDFEGFPGEAVARIDGTDMEGHAEYSEHGSGDGVVRFEVVPGEYGVSWRERGDLRRYAAQVRVSAGKTTRFRAADPGHVLTDRLPAGLGVLDVRLAPADGRAWQGVAVTVVGVSMFGRDDTYVQTNAEGRCLFRLRPGAYEVSVNAWKTTVEITAGERRVLELAPKDEGDLIIECDEERVFDIWNEERRDLSKWTDERADTFRAGYLFIPPGVYHLSYRPWGVREPFPPFENSGESSGRKLEEVVVRPREATVFRFQPPKGSLLVTVEPGVVPIGGLNPRLTLTAREHGTIPPRVVFKMENVREGARGGERRYLRARVLELGPARYRLQLNVPGAAPVDTEVVVGHDEAKLDLLLEKKD